MEIKYKSWRHDSFYIDDKLLCETPGITLTNLERIHEYLLFMCKLNHVMRTTDPLIDYQLCKIQEILLLHKNSDIL